MSDTPRTDAVIKTKRFWKTAMNHKDFEYEDVYYVPKNFARELERENNRLREQRNGLRVYLSSFASFCAVADKKDLTLLEIARQSSEAIKKYGGYDEET